ncbi:MAG: hypothetical protein C4K60_00195 [Ideonella sp. MAG2]|nr:MAG: hypothetical protein C4K60_00195 [Ideonella sp. MAG2]
MHQRSGGRQVPVLVACKRSNPNATRAPWASTLAQDARQADLAVGFYLAGTAFMRNPVSRCASATSGPHRACVQARLCRPGRGVTMDSTKRTPMLLL